MTYSDNQLNPNPYPNGRTFFGDRHHSDLITSMPGVYRTVSWIEVEAKHKEFAIDKLRAEWPAVAES